MDIVFVVYVLVVFTFGYLVGYFYGNQEKK